MERIIEFNDMKSALVDIEMDISGLKIWCKCFPDFDLRMQPFYLAPGSVSYSFTVSFWQCEKKVQFASRTFCMNDCAANRFAIVYDPICFTLIYAFFYRSAGNDFIVLLKLIISQAKLFYRSIFKRPLIVLDELLSVVFM